ncbi:MFS transporter, partial [Rothia dentocariosa]
RVPFLASIALVGLGWFIRAKVPESPDFEKVRKQGKAEKSPVTAALRRHPREVLTIVGARAAENPWFYMVVTFALAYATQQLHLPKAEMLHAITAGAALSLVTMPLCGHLSDRIGQRRMFAIGLVLMCAFAAPFFMMLGTQQTSTAWWAIVLGLGVVF